MREEMQNWCLTCSNKTNIEPRRKNTVNAYPLFIIFIIGCLLQSDSSNYLTPEVSHQFHSTLEFKKKKMKKLYLKCNAGIKPQLFWSWMQTCKEQVLVRIWSLGLWILNRVQRWISNSDSSALSRSHHPFLYFLPHTNNIVHTEEQQFYLCLVKKNIPTSKHSWSSSAEWGPQICLSQVISDIFDLKMIANLMFWELLPVNEI